MASSLLKIGLNLYLQTLILKLNHTQFSIFKICPIRQLSQNILLIFNFFNFFEFQSHSPQRTEVKFKQMAKKSGIDWCFKKINTH